MQYFRSKYSVCYLCCQFFTARHQLKTHLLQHLKRGAYCFYCEYKVCSQHTDTDLTAMDLREFDPDAQPIASEEEQRWASYLITRMRSSRSFQPGCPVCEVHDLYANIRKNDPHETQPIASLQNQLRTKMQQRVRALHDQQASQSDNWNLSSGAEKLSHIFSHLYYSPFQCKLCQNQKHVHAITFNRVLSHIEMEHANDLIQDLPAEELVQYVEFPTIIQFVNFYAGFFNQKWTLNDTLPSSDMLQNGVDQQAALSSDMRSLGLISNGSDSNQNGDFDDRITEEEEMECASLAVSQSSVKDTNFETNCLLNKLEIPSNVEEEEEEEDEESSNDSCSINFSNFRDMNHLNAVLDNEGYQIPIEWFQCKMLISEVRLESADLEKYPELFESSDSESESIPVMNFPMSKLNDYYRLNCERIPNNITSALVVEMREKLDPYSQVHGDSYRFYCPGCSQLINNDQMLYKCLKIDLKYLPITCKLCKKSTPDVISMSVHYFDYHRLESHLRISVNVNPQIEKWLELHVSRQRHTLTSSNQILRKLDPYCLCCMLVPKLEQTRALRLYNHKKEYFDVEHMFDHMRYYPYKCKLCPEKNAHYFSSPGRNAFRHFKNHHFKRLMSSEIEAELELVNRIESVERLIKQSIDEVYAHMEEGERYCSNYDDLLYEMLKTSVAFNEKKCRDAPKESSQSISQPEVGSDSIKKRRRTAIDSVSKPKATPKGKTKVTESAIKSSSRIRALCSATKANELKANGRKFGLVCCFCRTVTTSKPEFVAHLSSHLDYKPIACQHCNNNFANEIDFQFHGQQHPQLETIKYAMARHRYYDSWVEQLAAAISNDDTFSLDFIDCCPVCRTFYDAQNPTSSAIGNENESAVNFERPSSRNLFQFYIFNQIKYTQIRHVYQHFCYFPYRCKICHGKNENVCFPLLDEGCAAHLKKHNIRHLCPTNIFDYIDRLNIFLLDDLLTSHNLTDTSFRRIDCNRCLRTN